jgi:hypothetical protein
LGFVVCLERVTESLPVRVGVVRSWTWTEEVAWVMNGIVEAYCWWLGERVWIESGEGIRGMRACIAVPYAVV